jgi:Tfp pilus assembly protein PilO
VTQRDRIVVAVLATVALLGGFYMGILKPKRAEVAALDGQVAQQVERRDAALQRVAQGESAKRNYRADYATVARLGKAVPDSDQMPSLLYALESTADKHDVDFRSLKLSGGAAAAAPAAPASGTAAAAAVAPPGSSVGPAGFPTLPFAFKFDGGFHRMERFLSAIESYTTTVGSGKDVSVRGRLVTIDGIALEAGLNGFPEVKASLAATAYILPPEEGLTGGATPQGPATAPTGTAAGATPAPGAAPAAAPKTPTTTASVRGVTP